MMQMTKAERVARAELLTEWIRFHADAVRFGSADPGAVADVLVFGEVQRG